MPGILEGVRPTTQAIAPFRRAKASLLALPGQLPCPRYDAIVVTQLVYYLSLHAIKQVARDVWSALRPIGRLVLAQHRVDLRFHPAREGIHRRSLAAASWVVTPIRPASAERHRRHFLFERPLTPPWTMNGCLKLGSGRVDANGGNWVRAAARLSCS